MRFPKFNLRFDKDDLSSNSGLVLCGKLLSYLPFVDRLNGIRVTPGVPEIVNSDIVTSMLGLTLLGKPSFEAINSFSSDDLFFTALGIDKRPSSETLRQRLDLVNGAFDTVLKEESASAVRCFAPGLTAVRSDTAENLIPLDIDVSCFENSRSKKEGTSRTYKGFDGYSPIFAYLGESEGFLVNTELREGKTHCQSGTPKFIEESVEHARQITEKPLLVRLDSGNDAQENIDVCDSSENVFYLIKRNLRRESLEEWLEVAKENGSGRLLRKGKRKWIGETARFVKGGTESQRIVYEITERTITAKGERLLIPEIEVNTWWTNLTDKPADVIELYHAHGTSEQFHSELKSDMDLERLPSGHFPTNSLVLLLGMFAYNLLRICGQMSIQSLQEEVGKEATQQRETSPSGQKRKPVKRRRVKTVLFDFMYLACRIVRTGRKMILSFGKHATHWSAAWEKVYKSLCQAPHLSRRSL